MSVFVSVFKSPYPMVESSLCLELKWLPAQWERIMSLLCFRCDILRSILCRVHVCVVRFRAATKSYEHQNALTGREAHFVDGRTQSPQAVCVMHCCIRLLTFCGLRNNTMYWTRLPKGKDTCQASSIHTVSGCCVVLHNGALLCIQRDHHPAVSTNPCLYLLCERSC